MKSIQHQVDGTDSYFCGSRIQALTFVSGWHDCFGYVSGQSVKTGKRLAKVISADMPSLLGFFRTVLEMYGYKVTPPDNEPCHTLLGPGVRCPLCGEAGPVLVIPIGETLKWELYKTMLCYELTDMAWKEAVKNGIIEDEDENHYIHIKIVGDNFAMYLVDGTKVTPPGGENV